MKRKELARQLSNAVCNCLVNAEENKEAMRAHGVDPAVLRGMAYGLSAAAVLLRDDVEGFDGRDAGLLVGYASLCESMSGLDAEGLVSRLIGRKVKIEKVADHA